MTWRSNLDPRHDEFRYITGARMNGRDIDFTVNFLMKPTPDDRTAFETVDMLDCEASFSDGTRTVKLDFHGMNTLTAVADATPLEKRFENSVTLANYLDPANNEDFGLVFTGYP